MLTVTPTPDLVSLDTSYVEFVHDGTRVAHSSHTTADLPRNGEAVLLPNGITYQVLHVLHDLGATTDRSVSITVHPYA